MMACARQGGSLPAVALMMPAADGPAQAKLLRAGLAGEQGGGIAGEMELNRDNTEPQAFPGSSVRHEGDADSQEDGAITVGRPTRAEMDIAASWADIEGWNVGLHDVELYHEYGTEGFLVARQGGRPVGFIFSIFFPDKTAACGVFIVEKNRRNGSIGRVLGRAVLKLHYGWNVATMAVADKVHAYSTFGYQAAYPIKRYEGLASGRPAPAGPAQLVPLTSPTDLPLAAIAAYDRHCFPADRTRLLRLWCSQPGTVTMAAMVDGVLAGYGVSRIGQQGCCIEPLFADNRAIAEQLLHGLLAQAPAGTPYIIDIACNNPQACAMVAAHGWKFRFATMRMYSRYIPAIDSWRVYGDFL
ncbi:MAG TPA: hypothetical protein PKM88_02070 [bacterium]|nr:hypothetical protein [bacterium]